MDSGAFVRRAGGRLRRIHYILKLTVTGAMCDKRPTLPIFLPPLSMYRDDELAG